MEYLITEENRLSLCDEISGQTVEFCSKYLKDKKEILRYRLSVEEYLLNWLDMASIGKTLTFSCGKKLLRKPYIELSLSGEQINPATSGAEEEYGSFSSGVLHLLGLSPAYSYKKHTNILRFELNYKRFSTIRTFLIVILAAVAVGLLGLLLPDETRIFLRDGIISPVYNKFFGLLGCIAGPMIFLSVAWGVYGIGDASTLSHVGKKMLLIFLAEVFIAGVFALTAVPLVGLELSSSGTGNADFTSIFNLLLDIIPTNIVEPFSSGNTMQVIFMGFCTGIVMLILGKSTESVAKAVSQVNLLIQFMMKYVTALVPYVVFLVIINLLWSDSAVLFLKLWKFVLINISVMFLYTVLYYVFMSVKMRVKITELVKKCIPSFLIAFTTASSTAAFSSNVDICKNKLGISDSLTGFGVPLAVVIHKPVAAINFQVFAFYFAKYCGIECTVSWLITSVFICSMVAIAIPPVPGGIVIALTILWAQLGIPTEVLGLAMAIEVFLDFFCTACEMACLPPSLTNVASKTGMLDRRVLEKRG